MAAVSLNKLPVAEKFSFRMVSLLWALSGPFLGVYVIVQNLNIPLMLQPQLFATLASVSWAQVKISLSCDCSNILTFLVSLLWKQASAEYMHITATPPSVLNGRFRGRNGFCCQSELLKTSAHQVKVSLRVQARL